MHMLFFDNSVVVRCIVVVLCLATFGWPPAVDAAAIVLTTDDEPSEVGLINSRRMPSQYHCHCGYSSAVDNDGTRHHHDRRPAAVTEPYPSATAIYKSGAGHHHDRRPVAVTGPHPAAANTWAGRQHDRRPAAVTESYPSATAIDNDGTGHRHHDCRPAAVTEPHPAAANTWAGRHHDRTTANCPMADSCPIHHEHLPYNQLTSVTDETVTADVSASVDYYDEANAEDTNDNEEYPINNFVPIILIALFFFSLSKSLFF